MLKSVFLALVAIMAFAMMVMAAPVASSESKGASVASTVVNSVQHQIAQAPVPI
ncbi:hypothetical protein GGF38_001164, partial [Coemansia sp. RSA 25]